MWVGIGGRVERMHKQQSVAEKRGAICGYAKSDWFLTSERETVSDRVSDISQEVNISLSI